MPYSYNVPSQTLESYQPLPAALDMETSLVEHIPCSPRHHHSHGHGLNGSHRPNYYSSAHMWVCCGCGDGPKLYSNQTVCVICSHSACSYCEGVK
ncbi:uncharacterized protein BDV14DRAFT_179686 [Aspergillus stella-maris]|uniref:uncharacterized protein n=1 Tax=Aspergillus stella-maris TaxID=1810926 RepID=UPI003CCD4F79